MNVKGVRVLIVEDEAIIAMTAEDMLEELGCVTAAVAATLAEAEAAVSRGGFDVALLDINLNGVDSLPVAARLEAAGLPFIFTTGYGASGRDSRYERVPLVTKPYQPKDLADAIARALAARPG
jgi:CheY-like chemotaxis protein